MKPDKSLPPAEYLTRPLALFTVADLTDALGVDRAAAILKCTRRYIYSMRYTNALAIERVIELINAVEADEDTCRRRLVVLRQTRTVRKPRQRAAQPPTL